MRWTPYLSVLIALAVASSSMGAVFRVDVDSTAQNPNGSTWPLAFQHLQDALAEAGIDDQIWVAAGTYYPDLGDNQTVGHRFETFPLGPNAPKVYGGFVGTESNLEDRDWADPANETILSGNIGDPKLATDNTPTSGNPSVTNSIFWGNTSENSSSFCS